MATILREGGLDVYVGPYSVRILKSVGWSFSFQSYGGDLGSPVIAADAVSQEIMIHGGALVSNALTAAGVRHRFEVYDTNSRLVAYLHHKWPQFD